MMVENEIWRPVVGYESSYEVSNCGKVRSIDRDVAYRDGRVEFWAGRELTPKRQKSGHLGVSLCANSVKTRYRIHSLMLAAFVGPRPEGLEVRHLDGNPTNNVLGNLAYGTHSQNRIDAYLHGGRKSGQECHLSKISNSDMAVLKSLKGEISTLAAALRFGLSRSYVSQIWGGKRRTHA